MLLSAGMIRDELSECFRECIFQGNDQKLNLTRALFYDNELTLRGDTLYFFPEEELISFGCMTLEPGTAVVIREMPDPLPEGVSVLLLSDKAPKLASISNRVTRVFEKYNRYEATALELAGNGKNLQSLISFATPFFGNELTVRDGNYRYLGQSYRTVKDFERAAVPQPLENGLMHPETLASLKRNQLYEKETHSREPVYWHASDWKLNYIYLDIFDHERFLYRIKVCDVNQPLRAYDGELLKHLAGIIHDRFYRFAAPPGSVSAQLQKIVTDLMDRPESVTDNRLSVFLDSEHWRNNEHFLVAALRLNDTDEAMDNFSWYCTLFHREFEGVFAFCRDKRIFLLVNLDRGYQGKRGAFLSQLTLFIRSNDLRVGISNEFSDLLRLRSYALQAQCALDIGMEKKPYVWVHRFGEQLVDCIRASVTDRVGGLQECFPAIEQLEAYDRAKDADLLKTLRTYLENDRNLSQTASALFIHRGTLSYRLEKIEKILGFSLDNNEKIIPIRLALILLPNVGK